MEWNELHAPSVDKHLNEVNFKSYSEGMKEVDNKIYSLDISDDWIPLDSERGMEYMRYVDQVTILITNACNLGCKYCYEQHRKNFGKFDVVRFLKVAEFLKKVPSEKVKSIQFFGGEPLLEKNLILDCVKAFNEQYRNDKFIRLSLITNGILLSKEFIDEYLSYPFTTMALSLDIDSVDLDNRGLTADNMEHIYNMLSYIKERYPEKLQDGIMLRTTIADNQVERFEAFITDLVEKYGLESITIHPLTMSAEKGFIIWPDEKFDILEHAMENITAKYNVRFTFLEGSGFKGSKNCIMASDGFSMDASGDIAGCYFVVNRKDELGTLILGNLFENKLYYKRYDMLFSELQKMLNSEEQCKNCTLEFCYQCSAGNYTSFGVLFRPDEMCQKLIRLSDKTNIIYQKREIGKKFFTILESLKNNVHESIDFQALKMISYLFLYDLTYRKITTNKDRLKFEDILKRKFETGTTISNILYWYEKFISSNFDTDLISNDVHKFFDTICGKEKSNISLKDFVLKYAQIKKFNDVSSMLNDSVHNDITSVALILTILHILVLNWHDKRRINNYIDTIIS